jgi:hypothetical protein
MGQIHHIPKCGYVFSMRFDMDRRQFMKLLPGAAIIGAPVENRAESLEDLLAWAKGVGAVISIGANGHAFVFVRDDFVWNGATVNVRQSTVRPTLREALESAREFYQTPSEGITVS